MGMSLDATIPQDGETAVSLLGESFPPAHAFEPILLALSLHPHRAMREQHVDDLFQRAVCTLCPQAAEWSQMAQIAFQGRSRLVYKGMEFQEGCNFAGAFRQPRKEEQRRRLYFPGPEFSVIGQPPAPERSFFTCEDVA